MVPTVMMHMMVMVSMMVMVVSMMVVVSMMDVVVLRWDHHDYLRAVMPPPVPHEQPDWLGDNPCRQTSGSNHRSAKACQAVMPVMSMMMMMMMMMVGHACG